MVASSSGHRYPHFQRPASQRESPQSGEKSTSLHASNLGAFPHQTVGGIRYHLPQNQLDAQHPPNIPAVNLDYDTSASATSASDPYSPHYDAALDGPLGVQASHHPPVYAGDFSYPQRDQLPGEGRTEYQSFDLLLPGQSTVQPHSFSDPRRAEQPEPSSSYSGQQQFVQEPESMSLIASAGPSSRVRAAYASPDHFSATDPRKEASNQVIACRQCRRRKIKCDSVRPTCKNCVRRNNDCEYDLTPKRRGPDKSPGKRQRTSKRKLNNDGEPTAGPPAKKRRATTEDRNPDEKPLVTATKGKGTAKHTKVAISSSPGDLGPNLPSPISMHRPPSSHIKSPVSESRESEAQDERAESSSTHSQLRFEHYSHPLDMPPARLPREDPHPKFPPPNSSTLALNQRHFESFIRTYPLKDVITDVSFLFTQTNYWISFINLNFLLRNLADGHERSMIQPAFIFASLAMATLMKSSEVERGEAGRKHALWLRNLAYKALEDSLNNHWIDVPLAEAALILTLFELSAHPHHDIDRIEAALVQLDNIMRHLAITTLDHNHPNVTVFARNSVPVVDCSDDAPDINVPRQERRCTCIGPNIQNPPDLFTSWSYSLPWDATFTTYQIRDEECRRLCWCALGLVANYASQCTAFNKAPPKLFINDPGNYSILFPGEVMDRVSPTFRTPQSPSPKESIWALYCRSILLWTFCTRTQTESLLEADRAEQATEAWGETTALQDSLDMHDCNLDTGLIYLCREFLYNTRLIITQVFRSLRPGRGPSAPLFNQKNIREWVDYQYQVINRVTLAIQRIDTQHGYQLTRQPYQVSWFVYQLSICLSLWNQNRDVLETLDLAKAILVPVDVMNALWPSATVQSQCQELRSQLTEACTTSRLSVPPPPEYNLPPVLKK